MAVSHGGPGWLSKVRGEVAQWWPNALAALGTAIVGLMGSISSAPLPAVAATLASLFGQWSIYRRTQGERELRGRLVGAERARDLAIQELRSVLRAQLVHLARSLDFHSSERISLFIPAEGAGLRLVMRFSDSRARDLGTKARTLYREDEGCLGVAWRDGEKFVEDLPERSADPDGWANRQGTLGIRAPLELTMPSRTYGAFRLELQGGPHVGVVVYESESTDAQYAEQKAYRAPKIARNHLKRLTQDEMEPLCALATAARLLP